MGCLTGKYAKVKGQRAISTVVARFLHTEEVTGSNPVSPIEIYVDLISIKSSSIFAS